MKNDCSVVVGLSPRASLLTLVDREREEDSLLLGLLILDLDGGFEILQC